MIGQSVGSDANRLSCFLFRPRKNREKLKKRSHINASNASVIRTSRVSQTPLQTPIPYFHQWVPRGKKALVAIACKTAHVRFHGRKRVHTRLCSKDRTQRLTRRNTGHFGWGAITTLGLFHTFRKPCVAGCQNGVLCRFWVLVRGALEERREPRDSDALMRVAVPRRRGPAGLRRPTPPAERTVLAPISPRVQLCLRRPAFPLSAFIPGA